MLDLEERLTRVLRDRAAGEVDAATLAAAATARGRTRLIRRRLGLTVAAALAVLGVVFSAPLVLPDGGPGGGGRGHGDRLAAAGPEVPGAAERPDLVGADPNVLHFTVDPAVGSPVNWASMAGREAVQIKRDDHLITIDVARSVAAFEAVLFDGAVGDRPKEWADTTVDGRPAKVGIVANSRVLRWSPVSGVWIDVSGPDVSTDALRGVAEGLWLYEARRCSVPFQLTALPAGARVTGCEVNVRSYPRSVSGTVFVTSSGSTMQIHVERGSAGSMTPNYEVAGRAAYLYPAHDELELLDQQGLYVGARAGNKPDGLDVADAALVLGGLRLEDPQDLASWPSPLVSPS
jgi:hypothetical protein